MQSHTPFTTPHKDRITSVATNTTHTRLLTTSIDHRIAVYHTPHPRASQAHPPTLLDLFTAHDAQIYAATFLPTPPGTATFIASIAADLSLRIFTEDVSQQLMSGRRFRRLTTIRSETFTPFVSLDTKTTSHNDATAVATATIYIAAIDRQGLLSLYEPSEPEQYKDWSLLHRFHVSPSIPPRGVPATFKLCFDPTLLPLPYVTSHSDDRAQLSLFVLANDRVKVYRSTDPSDHNPATRRSSLTPGYHITRAAVQPPLFVEVLSIDCSNKDANNNNDDDSTTTTHRLTLKAIAVAPLHHRDHDLIALASSTGSLSIYSITLAPHSHTDTTTHKSSIAPSDDEQISLFGYAHAARLVWAAPRAHRGGCCAVKWHRDGRTLLSTGADGTVKIWRKHSESHWECAVEKKSGEMG